MMRAKVQIGTVSRIICQDGSVSMEQIQAHPVCGNFGQNGESEDNTFARYTPSGNVELSITNPDLFGKFRPGQKFYVDFTLAE